MFRHLTAHDRPMKSALFAPSRSPLAAALSPFPQLARSNQRRRSRRSRFAIVRLSLDDALRIAQAQSQPVDIARAGVTRADRTARASRAANISRSSTPPAAIRKHSSRSSPDSPAARPVTRHPRQRRSRSARRSFRRTRRPRREPRRSRRQRRVRRAAAADSI